MVCFLSRLGWLIMEQFSTTARASETLSSGIDCLRIATIGTRFAYDEGIKLHDGGDPVWTVDCGSAGVYVSRDLQGAGAGGAVCTGICGILFRAKTLRKLTSCCLLACWSTGHELALSGL